MKFRSKIFPLLILAATFAQCKKDTTLKSPEYILVDGAPIGRANTSVMEPASGDVAWIGTRNGLWGYQRASTRGETRWFHPLNFSEQPYSITSTDNFDLYACGITSRDYPNKKG